MFGHSAVGYAVELARRTTAKRLMLFHHDPPRTDDQLDAMVAGLDGSGVSVTAAAEGMSLDLPSAP
jgi:ribonuclease BN (tRNA processing enzyme)